MGARFLDQLASTAPAVAQPRRLAVTWDEPRFEAVTCYDECITPFTEHLPWLNGEDPEWVMGRGVSGWLSWPVPE